MSVRSGDSRLGGLGGFVGFGVLSVFSEIAIIMINIVFCILKINAGKEIKKG